MTKIVAMFSKVKLSLFGLRKLLVILIFTTIGVVFRLTEHINGAEMVDLLKVTGAAFFASNMINKLADAIKSKLEK